MQRCHFVRQTIGGQFGQSICSFDGNTIPKRRSNLIVIHIKETDNFSHSIFIEQLS